MDLKVIEQVQKLTWNFEEVKAELTNHIEKYVGLVVNDENLSDMEKTQKEIAGLRTKLQKFRLAVKKDLEKPYNAFELQIKELAGLVESAELPIKDQLEKYENRRVQDKENACKEIISRVAEELGLKDIYKEQIVVDSKWTNRGPTIKAITEEIQMRVVYFLEQQRNDLAREAEQIEKVNMAQMMCEFLSKDLVTPVTFREVENKIESFNITELRAYIENLVASRKEQEERAKKVALERAEQERIVEVARQEKAEQARLAEVERQAKIAEPEDKQPDIVFNVVEQQEVVKKYNAQFVLYDATLEEINSFKKHLEENNYSFQFKVKEV